MLTTAKMFQVYFLISIATTSIVAKFFLVETGHKLDTLQHKGDTNRDYENNDGWKYVDEEDDDGWKDVDDFDREYGIDYQDSTNNVNSTGVNATHEKKGKPLNTTKKLVSNMQVKRFIPKIVRKRKVELI